MARTSKKFGTQEHPYRYTPGTVPADLFPRTILVKRTGIKSRELTALMLSGKVSPVAYTTSNIALFDDQSIRAILDYRRSDRAPGAEPVAVADAYTREDSIEVFGALRKGMALVDIVIATGVDPRHVESIAGKYAAMTSCILINGGELAKLNQRFEASGNLPIDDESKPVPVTSFDALFDVVRTLTKRRVCRRCREHAPADDCVECVVRALEKELERRAAANAAPQTTSAEVDPAPQESAAATG